MFGIGFSEILIVVIAGFLFVGPKRMASVAQDLGTWVGKFRSSWTTVKESSLKDLDTTSFYDAKTELNKSLNDLKKDNQA